MRTLASALLEASRRRFAAALLSTSLLLALVAAPAQASPLFELTGGVGEQTGFGGRVTGAGAASTYFNPALLPKAHPGFYTGLFLLSDQIDLTLDARTGVDVPMSLRGATHADGSIFRQPSVPTSWLEHGCKRPACSTAMPAHRRQGLGSSDNTEAYQAVGLVVPMLARRVVFGVYGLVPLAEFTKAQSFFVDEREQFFTNSLHPELYSDRLAATSLAFGLGVQILPRLSLGIDATLSLRNTANAQTFVGNADDLQRTLLLSTDVGVKVSLAPHFGLVYDATDRLHLAATLHTVQRVDIVSATSTFLPNGNKQMATRTAVHDYMPVRIGVGGSYDVITDGIDAPTDNNELSLSATAILALWSSYVDRQGERPLPGYAWHDTLGVDLGVRHTYDHFRTFLDVMYVPSPVPLQTGRTNYVDNDRISMGAGIDYDFIAFNLGWRVGAQAQLHMLADRHQSKIDPTASGLSRSERSRLVRDELPDDAVDTRGDPIPEAAGLQTNNPGWPGFGSSGFLFGAGVNLGLLL
jgi:long-chain fatty acid transport protein